ncbi:MAG TPA: hypothetical protein VG456_14365 [Candidatus Sulfopaludibacter sp.]|jgi:hypothetical protein|nr:hypothetical protein [Candidatus Sulfopaludibacter sp.]
MRYLCILLAALTISCSPDTKTTPVAETVQKPKPADESRRFPKTNLVETKVVDSELMGKKFMPGGTLAHYKRGAVEYDMFIAKSANAAYLLPDWDKALTNSKLVPSFGGYFGEDAGRPVFVFSKGDWIAGIAGLPAKDADTEARTLATRIE